MTTYLNRRDVLHGTFLASAVSLLALPQATAQIPVGSARHFISQDSFVIAHRGSGAVNPEHTAYAYSEAIRMGARAVEISVRSTRDGQLVCMHDATLNRVTGVDGSVSEMTLAELKKIHVNMGSWLGSGTPTQPISTLDEALDAIAATPAGGPYKSVGSAAVLFIEAKNHQAFDGVLNTIVRRGLQKQVVLKMFRNGEGAYDPYTARIHRAKAQGLVTWSYFDKNDSVEGIQAMAASSTIDMLGAPYFETVRGPASASMTEEQIRQMVALGKPVIVWEVHRRSDVERLRALGVRGFMSTNPYWVSGGQPSSDISLVANRRLHGMLPAGQQAVKNMPVFKDASIIHQQDYDDSLLLGPLSTVAQRHSSYVMRCTLRWHDRLPSTTWQYGYIAFGRQTDEPFGLGRKFVPGPRSGAYVLAVRPGASVKTEEGKLLRGDAIQLLRYDHGQDTPVVVKTLKPARPFAANQDIPVKIVVRPQSLVIEVAGARAEVFDAVHRGPYSHFGRYHNNEVGGPLALHSVKAYPL